MGARAGYTLVTGLVIGVGAALGVLSRLVTALPEAAVAPILIFVGLEITAQAFHASPRHHGPAVALAFVPVAAAVVIIQTSSLLGALGRSAADFSGDAALGWQALLVLGNGFILTAILWAWTLTAMLDGQPRAAAALLAFASLAALCGLIHSPLPSGALFLPWSPLRPITIQLAGAYGVAAVICWMASARHRGKIEA
jgi:AGZA family xanthine/uracil permease-like MFS transporter